MAKDLEFMLDHKLMDYSLLFAVEKFVEKEGIESQVLFPVDEISSDDDDDGQENVIGMKLGRGAINAEGEGDDSGSEDEFTKRLSAASGPRQSSSFWNNSTPTAKKKITDRETLNLYLLKKGIITDRFNRHQFLSSDGRHIYHISIIDYLQVWNTNKKCEHFAKKWFLNKNSKMISAVEPNWYQARFRDFMSHNVFVNN